MYVPYRDTNQINSINFPYFFNTQCTQKKSDLIFYNRVFMSSI